MLKIKLSKKSQKFLAKLPMKHARQIKTKIQGLRVDPNPHDSKQLIGMNPYKRTDVGEYRIIYKTENDTLIISFVGKRNDGDVYKRMERLLN